MKEKKIKVKLVRSGISCLPKHRAALRCLGLTRLNQERDVPDNPAIRGMLAKLTHLVSVVKESL